MQWWHTLLASPVLVAAVPLAKRVFEWWTADRAQKSVQQSRKIYAAMNDAQFRLGSDRILIKAAHNCGGPLRPDVLLYVDALYEVVGDMEPRLERMINVRIDAYMIELMSRLIKEGVVWTDRSDVPQGSYIRNMYETDGVEQACSFLIKVDQCQIVYGVAHFKKKHDGCPQQQDTVSTVRSALTLLLK